MMSHRSGETEDTTIADLVVALGTARISPARRRAPSGSRSTTASSASKRALGVGAVRGRPLARSGAAASPR